MNTNDLIEEKFLACTGYSLDILKHIVSTSAYIDYTKQYRIDDFRNCLEEHGMADYADYLYYYMILECRKHGKVSRQKIKNQTFCRQDLEFQEELVLSLKELLTGGILKFTITNITKQHIIRHPKINTLLQSSIINFLSDAIRESELNIYPLPKEDVIEDINNQTDVEWIKKWMDSMGYIDPCIY